MFTFDCQVSKVSHVSSCCTCQQNLCVMSCLEIIMGKLCETAFGLIVKRDFQCLSLTRAHYDTNFIDRDKMIKAFDA